MSFISYILIGFIFSLTLYKPLLGFWISLALYFDPGGFFEGYFSSNLIGQINFYDAFFFMMAVGFIIKGSFTIRRDNSHFMTFFKYLIFVEFYLVLVYGYIIPEINNHNTFLLFLIKERSLIYGIFMLWFVYIFVQKALDLHYKITIYSGLIILAVYVTGQLVGFNIVPSTTLTRYQGESMLRIGMLSYGLFQIVFPMALLVFILNRSGFLKIPLKIGLYIAGVLMVIVYLITLTRRTFINVAATAFFLIWITNHIVRIRQSFIKYLIAASLILVTLSLTFPSYIDYSRKIYVDTFLLLTTGQDTRGKSDYRVSGSGDLEFVKEFIKEKPLFGQGFSWMSWDEKIYRALHGDKFAKAWDAAQEVPVFYVVLSKGLAGILIYIPVYIFLISAIIRLFKMLKRNFADIIENEPIIFVFGLMIILNYVLDFTVQVYALFGNIGHPIFMIQAGILFGIVSIIEHRYEEQKFISGIPAKHL